MKVICIDDGSCREVSPADILREILPIEKPSHAHITLINGPYDGFRLAVSWHVWEGGKTTVEGHVYRRKGRDNAGWEYEGKK